MHFLLEYSCWGNSNEVTPGMRIGYGVHISGRNMNDVRSMAGRSICGTGVGPGYKDVTCYGIFNRLTDRVHTVYELNVSVAQVRFSGRVSFESLVTVPHAVIP